MDDRFVKEREAMVESQIAARGIRDPRVLQAMRTVPRELFVDPAQVDAAYDDRAMSIGLGQTISQPFIVALMTELLQLEPAQVVLEVGTGTGYQTAILATLCRHVYTIDRLPELTATAKQRLETLGHQNVTFTVGDGTRGWPEASPFDRIIVTAAGPEVPRPLFEQLVEGGRLLLPVGGDEHQVLTLVRREGGKLIENPGIAVRFVRLLGEWGFPAW